MSFKEGEDYYFENGLMVFTAAYHLKRGYCCGSGCRHCPYDKKIKVALSWSGGKDSALALFYLLKEGKYEIDHLFTTIEKKSGKVGLHEVPEVLIERQAAALGLPLKKLYFEPSKEHDAYGNLVSDHWTGLKKAGIQHIAFGDIFLQDLKAYRDALLERQEMTGIYPLWEKPGKELVDEFLDLNFKTCLCAVDDQFFRLDEAGLDLSPAVLDNMDRGADPAGENGEYHTFVYDGPIFKHPVKFTRGEKYSRTYNFKYIDDEGKPVGKTSTFHFCELSP